MAAMHGHLENCQCLIDRTAGAIAGVMDVRGRTALHLATESGQLESMKYLLSLGFSADYQDSDGRRCVVYAFAWFVHVMCVSVSVCGVYVCVCMCACVWS